jgi:hypothetical protein
MNNWLGLELKALVGLRPSFSAQVRFGEPGAPRWISWPASGLRERPVVSHISRKTSEMWDTRRLVAGVEPGRVGYDYRNAG